jgi:hypothetical protein
MGVDSSVVKRGRAARRGSVLTCDCAGTQPWVARVFFVELIVFFNLLKESMVGRLLTSVQNWPNRRSQASLSLHLASMKRMSIITLKKADHSEDRTCIPNSRY